MGVGKRTPVAGEKGADMYVAAQQLVILQDKIKMLENENSNLKKQISTIFSTATSEGDKIQQLTKQYHESMQHKEDEYNTGNATLHEMLQEREKW